MSEETQEIIYFSPIQADTKTPLADIASIAQSQEIDPQFVDYRLLDVVTSYTDSEHNEPVTLMSKELDIFDDTAFFIDESLNIEQSYHVEYFDIRQAPQNQLPKISIGANSSLTKVIAKIHASKDIKHVSGYENLLYDYIAKQLIKAKILVGIREDELRKNLTKIASILRIKEMIDHDITLTVTTGAQAHKPTDAQMIFHYKNNTNNIQNDKINHASRGFLQGVVAGDVIMECIKPKNGRNGRNVRGEFIKMPEPKDNEFKDINVNAENIDKIEDDTSIKFIAKKPGFVSDKGGVYDIGEHLEVNEINFRDTGSVQTSIDANVSLFIKEDDVFKDAIGTGVIVEAKEVNVRGNIAANAQVIADDVVIGGQTHGKAKIKSRTANIAVHIGTVEADDVSIDRLEGGTVIAKKARINSVVGGSITAEEIIIETLGSNCTMTAARLIDVKYLRGMNNRFIIDTSKMRDQADKIPLQLELIKKLEEQIDKIPKKLETKKMIIDENKGSINLIKAKVEELQNAKIVPPVTFMKKLKEYQQLVNDYNALLHEFKTKKAEHKGLKDELDVMQNGIFAAKVINRSNWLELNEIKFIVIDPPTEVSYITRQNEMIRIMTLTRDGDKFSIKKDNNIGLLQ
ncbi:MULTISPECIES: flagellar assembly protein A [unclassified Campylobacter]|uniref:flagellar assembly protein A n=1 Tax=unclassified Campylobacter TaxID=2593542 RepID=UPI003D347D5B